MLVAEELEVDWSKIGIEVAPVGPEYYHAQWGVIQARVAARVCEANGVVCGKAGASAE